MELVPCLVQTLLRAVLDAAVGTGHVEASPGDAAFGVGQQDSWIVSQPGDVFLCRFQWFHAVVAGEVTILSVPGELAGRHGSLAEHCLARQQMAGGEQAATSSWVLLALTDDVPGIIVGDSVGHGAHSRRRFRRFRSSCIS